MMSGSSSAYKYNYSTIVYAHERLCQKKRKKEQSQINLFYYHNILLLHGVPCAWDIRESNAKISSCGW